MAIEIIDGVGSENHVTSDQVGLSQAGTIGIGAIILPVGQQLGYEIISNNQVNIKDGVYVIQGKRGWIRSGTVEQCTIQTGNNGQYRNDLICIKYTKNAQSKLEEFSIAVVKGTPGASGTDPTYTTGDINDGALESYAPIYRVRLNGINIIGVDLMASKVSSLLETANKIGNLSDLATSAKTSLVAAANELQAAINELNGNFALKTYTNTNQFATDITDDSSLQLLINKMPDNSAFLCSIGNLPSSGWKSQMPEGYGLLHITRIDLGRVNMEYFPRNGGYFYVGTFSNSNTPNLGYWFKFSGTRLD